VHEAANARRKDAASDHHLSKRWAAASDIPHRCRKTLVSVPRSPLPTIILRPREETAALAGPRAAIRGYSVSPDNHHIQDDCYLTPYIEYLKAARFSPSLRYLFSELGIHLIPQAIAEKVEGQNGDHYGKAGKDHYEGCFSHEQTAVVEH
jgi:hypothetical protein